MGKWTADHGFSQNTGQNEDGPQELTATLPDSSTAKCKNCPVPPLVAKNSIRNKVIKFALCSVVAMLVLYWCFHVWKLQKKGILHMVSNRSFLMMNTSTLAEKGAQKETSKVKRGGAKDVPKDVITDSLRSKASGGNLCPLEPPDLVGPIAIKEEITSLEAVESEFPEVLSGGHYTPKECTSRHRVAILIPYRDRAAHLKVFIYNIHRVLARQQIDYGVFVIEQVDKEKFNRGKLLNVGVLESLALYDYQCFVFHDVDLVPTDDRNVYTCPEYPRHMSVRINKRSGVPYSEMFGGVSAVNKEQMLLANGFSNVYWGWGGEDDDLFYRLHEFNLTIHRRPANVARYIGLKHVVNKRVDTCRRTLAKWKNRWKTDGLNSVQYKRVNLIFKELYTWIRVDLRLPTVVMPSQHRLLRSHK